MRWIMFDEDGLPTPGSYSTQQPGPGQWVPDEDVQPVVTVPSSVSAAQGGIALINAGLMPAVQAAVDDPDTPAEVRWAWERATTWERPSPALAYLANKAGISSGQMDALFVAAAPIEV
ncbi:hypothetical protein [Bordetella petrii]|uniref:hypothetical protein n=1 Tax=Bordetella petrii TaxID=94624 RepID=UPI0005764763|nr:hypothetical protein [Bordetella petrii]